MTLLLSACGTDETVLKPTSFDKLPGWKKDQQSEALAVFAKSCDVNSRRANAWRSKAEGAIGDPALWAAACAKAESFYPPVADDSLPPWPPVTDDQARQFFEDYFTPVRVMTGREPKGRMTGYYEPLLRGSMKRGGPFQTPVYAVPKGNKHYSREEIAKGALRNHAQVLLYVDDPVMLFFLHIQGSGKVQLPDGKLVGLQYAGQNGYDYVAIGRPMADEGLITNISLQTIREWLYDHPGAPAQAIMNLNPSYIYFKMGPGDEYAKGAIGLPLTPLRSIAIDDDRATYGVPTYIATTRPKHNYGYDEKLRRLFVSQDTGGALHGPHRADLFFGRGTEEEWSAGHQNTLGKVYWLLPKVPTPPPAPVVAEPLQQPLLAAPLLSPDGAPFVPVAVPNDAPFQVVPPAPVLPKP